MRIIAVGARFAGDGIADLESRRSKGEAWRDTCWATSPSGIDWSSRYGYRDQAELMTTC